ncbi:esterase FrsA [Catenulispora sp. MAP5-51]|uniref:alpha/beta hydrolase n=1 Tax=Catenulispora sp. MAP5-51 TaxID=3156298 RepID=UPI00351726F6
MNDINELKQYVVVHAEGQGMAPAHYRALLDRIKNDDEGAPDSWAAQWSAAGDEAAAGGRLLEAARHYAMARFPYVNGPARAQAHKESVAAFDRWRQAVGGIERLDVPLPGGVVRCWSAGLSPDRPLPLLIIMGGIVTAKEQWAPVLAQGAALGVAAVVAELPGVGENTLPYTADSWTLISGIIDAVEGRADTSQTYALAMSFSGHLALRAAVTDKRIRGVVTTGAPVRGFFTDPQWQAKVPGITVDTLAELTGVKPAEVFDHIRGWALTDEELGALRIPVAYAASKRDEIIPQSDVKLLRRKLRKLRVVQHDDVHGSPAHVAEVRQWTVWSIMRMRKAGWVKLAIIGYPLLAARLKGGRRGAGK